MRLECFKGWVSAPALTQTLICGGRAATDSSSARSSDLAEQVLEAVGRVRPAARTVVAESAVEQFFAAGAHDQAIGNRSRVAAAGAAAGLRRQRLHEVQVDKPLVPPHAAPGLQRSLPSQD